MKRIFTLGLIVAALSFSGCKKCWDCGEIVDGHSSETCDKERMKAIEAGQVFTDYQGNPSPRNCH